MAAACFEPEIVAEDGRTTSNHLFEILADWEVQLQDIDPALFDDTQDAIISTSTSDLDKRLPS